MTDKDRDLCAIISARSQSVCTWKCVYDIRDTDNQPVIWHNIWRRFCYDILTTQCRCRPSRRVLVVAWGSISFESQKETNLNRGRTKSKQQALQSSTRGLCRINGLVCFFMRWRVVDSQMVLLSFCSADWASTYMDNFISHISKYLLAGHFSFQEAALLILFKEWVRSMIEYCANTQAPGKSRFPRRCRLSSGYSNYSRIRNGPGAHYMTTHGSKILGGGECTQMDSEKK